MITTLTGSNSYRMKDYLKSRIEAFVNKNGDLALEKLDCEDSSMPAIMEALQGISFFGTGKLVILSKPSAQKQFVEEFEQLAQTVPETTDVIIIEPKVDKRLSYYKTLKTKTEFIEYGELDERDLVKWLVDYTVAMGATISVKDAQYLLERVDRAQENLSNELKKLASFDPIITRETIDELTVRSPQSTIFDLIEAAMKGDTELSLKLYDEQRQQLVEPQQIIAMLTWQLHILAIILTSKGKSAQQIAGEAKINPYVISKSQNLIKYVNLPRVKLLIAELLDIDNSIKGSSIDADEALKNYIIELKQF